MTSDSAMRVGTRVGRNAWLLLALALMLGCGEQNQPPAAKSSVGPVPAEAQRPGDPQAGYRALVNEAYVTCGVPYSAYEAMSEPPAASGLLPRREGRNSELPYSLTSHVNADGVEIVSSNCLTCHAEYFNGELVVGLGNASGDFTEDPSLFAESVGSYVEGKDEAKAWRKWADRISAIAPYMITETIGVNPADNLTLALFAHRDPETLAWSDEPLLEPPPKEPLPVSVPPWWRMDQKHAMFYHGGGRGDHARWMMTASTLCTDSVAEAERIDVYFPDIRAFIYSLEPPEYPFPVDDELAKQGREVFEENCSACHGTYGDDPTYPNLIVGLEEIGTDPELALAATRDQDRFGRWFNQSFYGEIARAAPAPGYYAPPLDGVWATAPYLHNGSVPTIEALLDVDRRPTYWRRSFESTDYDPDALGWRHTALPHGQEGAATPDERKRIYDTTLPGYSNAGHEFGEPLTDAERRAVLEYLKTL